MNILKRIKTLWNISALPENFNKDKKEAKKISKIMEKFFNESKKQATIVDMTPKEDMFPNQEE